MKSDKNDKISADVSYPVNMFCPMTQQTRFYSKTRT